MIAAQNQALALASSNLVRTYRKTALHIREACSSSERGADLAACGQAERIRILASRSGTIWRVGSPLIVERDGPTERKIVAVVASGCAKRLG